MTVTSQTTKTINPGNGSSFSFSFSPLIIFASTDIEVTSTVIATGVETALVEGTGSAKYSVGIATYPATGSITYPQDEGTPVASTINITIKRVLTLEQQTDLNNQGAYNAAIQERQFDRLLMIDLQQQEEIDRCPKIAISDETTTLATLTANIISLAAIEDEIVAVEAIDAEVAIVAGDTAEIVIVAGDTAEIVTVAGISANVTTVAGISANVTTVAGISANVTTVAGISADVTTVANDGTDIGIVAGDTTEIVTVAGISANVTTVAGISADVTQAATDSAVIIIVAGDTVVINTVAGDTVPINTVAGDTVPINTVAGNTAVINTVAGISANVTTVAGIGANVTIVAGISANVTTVAGISANVTQVATDTAEVVIVAGISADVATVAGISTDVTAVATMSFKYLFDTTTAMADPGAGDIRYNNATPGSVTAIAISNTFKDGSDISPYIAEWGDSTTMATRGTLVIRDNTLATGGQIFTIDGAIVDNGAWLQIPVAFVSGATLPGSTDALFVAWSRTGDKGADGADGESGAEGTQFMFLAKMSSSLNLPTATNTKITHNSEVFDPQNEYDHVTNFRYTPQKAGKYMCVAQVSDFSAVGTGNMECRITKNGGDNTNANSWFTVTVGDTYSLTTTAIRELNGSTDFIENFVFNSSGSTETPNTSGQVSYFAAYWIGD